MEWIQITGKTEQSPAAGARLCYTVLWTLVMRMPLASSSALAAMLIARIVHLPPGHLLTMTGRLHSICVPLGGLSGRQQRFWNTGQK